MAFQSQENRVYLKQFLTQGKINYEDFFSSDWIDKAYSYITNHDFKFQDEIEEFAFWINAYNVLTLKSVEIELNRNKSWKGNTSFYSKVRFFIFRKFKVGTKKINLYNLENKILRKKFKDPRLHFVINCAATSCPFIPEGLIQANELEEMLEKYTLNFINDQGGVVLKEETVHLSRIFKWYKKDFSEGVLKFISKYWNGQPFPKAVLIEYQDYDWTLNEIKS